MERMSGSDISSDDEDSVDRSGSGLEISDFEIDFKYVSDEVAAYTGNVPETVFKSLKKFRDTLYLLSADEGTIANENGMKPTGNAGIGELEKIVGYMEVQEEKINQIVIH